MLLLKLSVLESVILSNIKDIHKYNTQVSPIKGHNIKERKLHKAAQTKAPESLDTMSLALNFITHHSSLALDSPVTQSVTMIPISSSCWLSLCLECHSALECEGTPPALQLSKASRPEAPPCTSGQAKCFSSEPISH